MSEWIDGMSQLTQATQRHKNEARRNYGCKWADSDIEWRFVSDAEVTSGDAFN